MFVAEHITGNELTIGQTLHGVHPKPFAFIKRDRSKSPLQHDDSVGRSGHAGNIKRANQSFIVKCRRDPNRTFNGLDSRLRSIGLPSRQEDILQVPNLVIIPDHSPKFIVGFSPLNLEKIARRWGDFSLLTRRHINGPHRVHIKLTTTIDNPHELQFRQGFRSLLPIGDTDTVKHASTHQSEGRREP